MAFVQPLPLAPSASASARTLFDSSSRRNNATPTVLCRPICLPIRAATAIPPLPPRAVSITQKHNGQKQQSRLRTLCDAIITLEYLTRPGLYSSSSRYHELPEHVKTPSQMLGRLSPGCEGTQGVFPRCNFSCKPCYHSETANSVRIDGFHTVTEIARQMSLLRDIRGPAAHCQLIGGEVSLLPSEDHALALSTMRYFGRLPMSFTHGDFDYDYLQRLALGDNGRARFERLDFAVHFDIDMRGRRGQKRLSCETELTPFRRRFVEMFQRLKREHGVRYYLAHNMTVQPRNLPSIALAVRDLVPMGFRLLSFQPAALQGAVARRVDSLRSDEEDDHGESVWRAVEEGIGMRLPYSLFQMGDVRCNRMCVLAAIGVGRRTDVRVFPYFDDECPGDVLARDVIMSEVGNIVLAPRLLFFKTLRVLLFRPWTIAVGLSWLWRFVRRVGGPWPILRWGLQPLTIVMHRFMDAEDVTKAWRLMEDGVTFDDVRVAAAGPRVRETMERLSSCSYAMAQPDHGRVVPACVQHSVYDPDANVQLAEELPLSQAARPAAEADLWFLKRDTSKGIV